MKVKRMTNLLKTGVFLFGISFLIWNCETETEISPSTPKLYITKVDASHFLNNYNVQSKLKERNNYAESSRRNNDQLNELLDFIVVGDYAKYVEEGAYHSYTFPITRENPIDGIQENFFLSLQPDGTYKEFLVWYYLDEETFVELENDLSLLVGEKMKMIDLGLLQEENNTASRSDFGDLVDALPDGCYEAVFCDCDQGGGYAIRPIDMENCPSGGSVVGNVGAPGTSTAGGSNEGGTSNGGGTGGTGTGEPAQIPDTTSPVSNPPICTGGKVLIFNECVCPLGTVENPNGTCIPNPCTGEKIYNSSTGNCDCPTGKVENKAGNCVDKCETTKEDLLKVFPNTNEAILQEIADNINKHAKDFGIDTDVKLQHFLAQAGHESKKITGYEFESFEENLNYKWKDLGVTKYKKLFNPHTNPTADPDKEDPTEYKRNATSIRVNSEKYANLVYDDENRDEYHKLGNTNVGDGYKFRGRGIFQLTGRYNYGQFTNFYQSNYDLTKDFETTPELLKTDTEIAVISALWYYKKKVLDKLDPSMNNTTSSNRVTYLVNGGDEGKKERKILFNKARTHITCK